MSKQVTVLAIFLLAVGYSFSQTPADSQFYKTAQSQWLSQKAGTWDVTMTLQPAADAKAIIQKGLEAERTMIGAFCLHEVMRPARGLQVPSFQRNADLDYNFNDAKWDYISIDTRITGGIMQFSNVAPEVKDSIVSYLLNSVHPGFGPQQTDRGKSLRIKNVILTLGPNHDLVKQYWKLPDGKEWLAVIYDYVKRN